MDSGAAAGPSNSSSAADPKTWGAFARGTCIRLHAGWVVFDSWAGWLLGLDNSKYQWAVAEDRLRQRREEREAVLKEELMNDEAGAAMNAMERAPGPEVMEPARGGGRQ